MDKTIKLTAILTVMTLMLTSFPLLVHASQEYASSKNGFSINMSDTNVTVENNYYRITIDLIKGARITEWTVKSGNNALDLVESESFMPSLSIVAYTRNETRNYTIEYGNETVTISSYPLLFEKWSASILKEENAYTAIEFTPSSRAREQIEPLNLSVIAYFYKNEPYVDFYYVFKNDAGSPVTLKTIKGDADLFIDLVVYRKDMNIDQWLGSVSYNDPSKGSAGIEIGIRGMYQNTFKGKQLSFVGVYNNNSKLVSIASPLSGSPIYAEVYHKISLGSKTIDGIVYSVAYSIGTLKPFSERIIGLRIMYGTPSPCSMNSMNALLLYKELEPQEYSLYVEYKDGFPQTIRKLNNTVSGLREARDNLAKRIDELNYQVEYWKGNATYWKTEWKVLKEQLANQAATVKRASTVSVGAAILGVVIGFIGGYLFYRKR